MSIIQKTTSQDVISNLNIITENLEKIVHKLSCSEYKLIKDEMGVISQCVGAIESQANFFRVRYIIMPISQSMPISQPHCTIISLLIC